MGILKQVKGIKVVEDVEDSIKLLQESNPGKRIEVIGDTKKKEYIVTLYSDKETKDNIEIPVFLSTQVVYGDTDSVMCRFTYNRKDAIKNRYDSFRLAEIAGEKLTKEIFARPPIEMEFEKVFCPMLLKGKKSYIAKMYDDTRDPLRMTKLHVAGVASKRRNYNEYYKKYADEIYDCLLETHLEDIIPITKKYIKDILDYKVSIDSLIISSLLGATYKTENLPHVYLYKKLKERNDPPQVGDRIPYIFVEGNAKDQKYLKVEDPEYAKEHNLKYDRVVYLEHISKPILGLLAPLLGREYPEILNGVYDTFCDAIKKCDGKKLPATLLKIKEHETVM
jgi:DNA polymerase delta subunit 1